MKKPLKITFTLIFTTILLLGFAMPLNPVGNWYQQFLPNLNGRTISDIFFLDSLTGWAVTPYLNVNDTSYVIKTTNSGDNWFIQHIRSGQFVGSNKIIFLNLTTGYTAGVSNLPAYSAILKTTDGGNTWSNINSPTNPFTARDISILSVDTIWTVSDNSLTGGVFRTTNGGANWEQQINVASANPDKIYMYNGRIGFCSGGGQLRKTTNSGLNWNVISGDEIWHMYFIDSLTGWFCGSNGMKKTTNGGLNWVTQALPTGGIISPFSRMLKFSVINKDTIFGTGGYVIYPNSQVRGIIYRTVNGGNNWLFQIPDTSTIHLAAGYKYIQFINKMSGWAYYTDRGIHTTTGGDPAWIIGIEQISTEIPEEYNLFQNYPNPFNPVTNIKYSVKRQTSDVKLIVFDIQGKQIAELVNQKQNPGTYEVDFSGSGYASGVYFYKLTVNTGKEVYTETKKMMMIK